MGKHDNIRHTMLPFTLYR